MRVRYGYTRGYALQRGPISDVGASEGIRNEPLDIWILTWVITPSHTPPVIGRLPNSHDNFLQDDYTINEDRMGA